jgi:arylsulfatase A-like enzyme
VPAIARRPGSVPAAKTSDAVWAFWDVMPTLAEVCGARAPEGLDGHSIAAALAGKPQQEHEFLYWEFHERGFKQGVRHRNWKAVRAGLKGKLELYDISKDIGEQNDVAGQNPQVVARIGKYLETARTESAEFPVKA